MIHQIRQVFPILIKLPFSFVLTTERISRQTGVFRCRAWDQKVMNCSQTSDQDQLELVAK